MFKTQAVRSMSYHLKLKRMQVRKLKKIITYYKTTSVITPQINHQLNLSIQFLTIRHQTNHMLLARKRHHKLIKHAIQKQRLTQDYLNNKSIHQIQEHYLVTILKSILELHEILLTIITH